MKDPRSRGRRFGISVASAGDVNGDARPDVIGGGVQAQAAPKKGYARVFSGLDGSVLLSLAGTATNRWFGRSVSDAGDANADGFADVVVGAPQGTSPGGPGYGRLVSGQDGSVLHSFSGSTNGDAFGRSVSEAHDLDGDGHDDVLVGVSNVVSLAGQVRASSGLDGSRLLVLRDGTPGDFLGFSVAGPGDVTGDGTPDVLAGLLAADAGGTDSGAVRLYSGADAAAIYTLASDSANDWFGFSVDGSGDLDGDGVPEVVVGAVYDDPNGTDSGSATVFSGCKGSGGAWAPYGSGLAGSGGFVPALGGSGCPYPLFTAVLSVSNGLGGTFGALFLGVNPVSIPLLPPGLPGLVGADVYFQSAYLDVGAPARVSLTGGLQLTIG